MASVHYLDSELGCWPKRRQHRAPWWATAAPVACKRGDQTCNSLPQTANLIANKRAHKRCKIHSKSHGNTEDITKIKIMQTNYKMGTWITRYNDLKIDRWTVKECSSVAGWRGGLTGNPEANFHDQIWHPRRCKLTNKCMNVKTNHSWA